MLFRSSEIVAGNPGLPCRMGISRGDDASLLPSRWPAAIRLVAGIWKSKCCGLGSLMTPDQAGALSPAQTKSPLLWIQLGVGAVLITALYGAVLADLANDWWTDPTLSQGLLIPPLALYIAWLRRHITFSHPSASEWRGLLLTAGARLRSEER